MDESAGRMPRGPRGVAIAMAAFRQIGFEYVHPFGCKPMDNESANERALNAAVDRRKGSTMITPEQRAMRRQWIGASDAPAIVGVDPWRTAADVYYSKVADLEDKPNPAMMMGNRLEGVLLDYAEEELGVTLQRGVMQTLDPAIGPLAANLDGLYTDAVVECKYVGPRSVDYWADGIPDHVKVQVQHQMIVTRRPRAYVAVALCGFGGLEFRLFDEPFDEDIAGSLLTVLTGWWQKYVVPQVPPADSLPCLEVLRKIRRLPDSILLDATAGALAAMRWAKRDELPKRRRRSRKSRRHHPRVAGPAWDA